MGKRLHILLFVFILTILGWQKGYGQGNCAPNPASDVACNCDVDHTISSTGNIKDKKDATYCVTAPAGTINLSDVDGSTFIFCGSGPYVITGQSNKLKSIVINSNANVTLSGTNIETEIINRGTLTFDGDIVMNGNGVIVNAGTILSNHKLTMTGGAFTNYGSAAFSEINKTAILCLQPGSDLNVEKISDADNQITANGGCLHFTGDISFSGNINSVFTNNSTGAVCINGVSAALPVNKKWGDGMAVDPNCLYCGIDLQPVNVYFCENEDLSQPALLQVFVRGGVPPYSIVWSPDPNFCSTTGAGGVIPFTCSAAAPGGGWSGHTYYNVQVTDNVGNTKNGVAEVSVVAKPVITVTSPAPVCEPTSVNIAGTAAGATSFKYYEDAGGTIEMANTTVSLPNGYNSPNAYTKNYWVRGFDANGCESDPVQGAVTINPKPAFIIDPLEICKESGGGTLSITGSSPASGVAYEWSPGTGLSATTGLSVTANPTATTVYTVTAKITNTGCTRSSTVTVTVKDKPTISIPNKGACEGTPTTITPTTISANGSPITNYVWKLDGVSIAGGTGTPGDLTYSFTTGGTLSLEATNACGTTTAISTISVNQKPTLTAISPQTICSGNSTTEVTLGLSPGAVANWTVVTAGGANGGSSGSGNRISGATMTNDGTTPGTVTYTVTPSLNGCEGISRNFIVNVNPKPEITNPEPSCTKPLGGTLQLSTNIAGGAWSSSNTSLATINSSSGLAAITPDADGSVTFTYTVGGCPATKNINFSPVCDITPILIESCPDESRKLDPNASDQICFEFQAKPSDSTSRYVVYTALTGGDSIAAPAINPNTAGQVGDGNFCVPGDKVTTTFDDNNAYYSVWIEEKKLVDNTPPPPPPQNGTITTGSAADGNSPAYDQIVSDGNLTIHSATIRIGSNSNCSYSPVVIPAYTNIITTIKDASGATTLCSSTPVPSGEINSGETKEVSVSFPNCNLPAGTYRISYTLSGTCGGIHTQKRYQGTPITGTGGLSFSSALTDGRTDYHIFNNIQYTYTPPAKMPCTPTDTIGKLSSNGTLKSGWFDRSCNNKKFKLVSDGSVTLDSVDIILDSYKQYADWDNWGVATATIQPVIYKSDGTTVHCGVGNIPPTPISVFGSNLSGGNLYDNIRRISLGNCTLEPAGDYYITYIINDNNGINDQVAFSNVPTNNIADGGLSDVTNTDCSGSGVLFNNLTYKTEVCVPLPPYSWEPVGDSRVQLVSYCPLCTKPDIPEQEPIILCAPEKADIRITLEDDEKSILSYYKAQPFDAANKLTDTEAGAIDQSGIYYIVAESGPTCKDTATVQVTINPKPVINELTADTPCEGETLNLTSSVTGTINSYAWSGPNGFTSTLQNPSITDVTAGASGEYQLIVTTAAGCKDTARVQATVNPRPSVTAENNSPICAGQTLTLTNTLTNAPDGVTYAWSGPGGFASVDPSPSIANAQPAQSGTYKLTVTSPDGCADSSQVTVTVNPLPICLFTVNPEPVCPNSEGITYRAPADMSSYAWSISGNGTITSATNNETVTVKAGAKCGQTFILKLIITDENGCMDSCTQAVNVENTQIPAITIAANDTKDYGCITSEPTDEPTFTVNDNCDALAAATVILTTPATKTSGCNYTKVWTASYKNSCGTEAEDKVVTYTWTLMPKPTINKLVSDRDLGCLITAPSFDTDTIFNVTDNCETNTPQATIIERETIRISACLYSKIFTAKYTGACGVEADSVNITFTWNLISEVKVTAKNIPTDLGRCRTTAPTFPGANTMFSVTDSCATNPSVTDIVSADDVKEGTCSYSRTYRGRYTSACGIKDSAEITFTWSIDPKLTETVYDTICASQLPYNWRDIIFPEGTISGTYIYTRTSTCGCDSIVTVTLTVMPTLRSSDTPVVCETELPFAYGDSTFSQAGVKDIYFRSLAGCDSIVTVTLTVMPTLRSSDTPVVCETELPFAYGDSTFTQAGVKDIYFRSLAGCDSIVTVTLTVMPTLRSSDTPVVCETELPFAYGDSTFSQAGVKDIYFRSLAGCDSIVTVTLTVTPTLRSSDTPVVCEAELPFAYGDSTFSQAGVKDIYFRSLAGCDSIVTVTLTVTPTLRSSDTPVVCETELPFAYGDSTFSQAGVKDIYFKSLAGCDSIVTVTLTVTPTLRSSDTPVVCETELPFAYGDSTFSQAGVKDIYFRSLAGCDSIVTVTLTVTPTLRSSDTPVVCETELPFAYGDSTFSQAGVKDIYFRSLAGCDSIVTVTLTVTPTLRSSDTPVVCETELPFAYGDSTFSQAGVKDIYFRSLAGCDSIVTVTLTVMPTLRSSDTPVVCETELPFAYGDSTFSQAGVKDIYFKSLAGCDSIVTVTLTVMPTLRSSDTPVVCEAELPFAYGDSTFSQAGVKDIYFRSLAGCDSIVTVTLTVTPTLRSSDTPVVCETELPFAYGDSTFSQAGVKDIYFKSLAGCDSIVTVTLTVTPTLRSSDTPVVCETELPFAYGDSTFTQAGVKDIYFRSLAGCDSIVTVTLTVTPTLRSSDTPVVCETELPFAYGDSTFSQAGVKDIYFRSLAGCDSIVTVTLTVMPTLRSSDTPVVCETELPFAYGDSTFSQAGVKDIYFKSLAGCDSIVTVTLTVMPTLRSSDTPVVCETELPFAYGDSTFSQAGVKDIYFRSLAGCDSIVTVTLTVMPTLRSSDTPVVCETELPFAYGDSTFSQAGVKDIYFRSLAGCDSIVTVTLTVMPTLRSSDTPVVCETELPFAYGDSTFTQAGVKDIYFRSLAGCDSIVTVTLTVMPTLRSSDTPVVCETELPFAYGDSTFTQAGVKDIYFRSLAGCDSIVTVTLTVTPTLRSSDTPVVCETELPFAYGDSTFTQAGVKDIYFRSLAGCDSIVTVTLTVMPTLRSSDTPVVCETELPFAYGDSIFTQAGVKDIYFRSLAGCDSIVTVTLTVMPTLRSSDTPVVCETELPFAYGDSTFTQAGVKDIYFRSLAGCDSIVTVTLTVTPTLRSSDTPVVCETELPFAYGDSTFTQAGVKDIYFRSLAGCDSIVTVTLTVTPTLRSSDTPVVCETELPFAYGDSTFTQAGVKEIYFRSLAGCDSIVTVTLTVMPTLRSSDTPVVCETELPFAYGDSIFTQAGVKDIYFKSLAGCDSIVTVTLTVMPTLRSSDTPVVCETELPFAYGDSTFTQAGVKDIYFRSLAGCDSIVTVTLTVTPTLRSSDTPVVCETELPFAYGDSTFTQAGVKDIYFRSLAGCDSIVTVTLTVTPTLRSSDTPVVCETELPFAYGDSTFSQAGVKDIYFRSLAGCDSIVTVTLTVTPTLRSSDTPVVCETELPFAYGDSIFTQAGVKDIYFRSLAGCDSIVTVTLTVTPTLRSSDTPVVCETELPFAYGDSIFTQAGVKDIYFRSLAGCDSIVTVTLTVTPTLRSSDTPVVCETELPFAYGDSIFTQAGVKDIYFRSLAGCDSIVTVTLTVMPTLRSSDTPVVCETELPFAYGDSTFSQAGVKDIYFRSLAGCDSIVTVTLTVTPTLRSSDTPVVCETELPFAYGDSIFTQAGVKDIYFRSLAGCDSIVTVTLTVMPTLRSSDTPVVCETELPFAYGDSIFTQAGVKDIYFRSLAGCDSIVTVTLTVMPTLRSSDTPVVCETELPFAYGDSIFTQAGVKDIYFKSLAGCDSIVTVTLTVMPTLRSSDTPVVCETELPFAYGDSIFTQAGVKDIYFRSLAGCDSIVTVTLTVMPTLRSSDTPVVCETELPFAYGDSTFTQAGVKDIYFRSLAGCDSIVTVTLTVTPTLRSSDTPVVCETELPFAYGDSTFTQAGVKDIYFKSLAGCDSIVTVTLTVMPTLRSSDTPVVCETELPFAYGDSIFTQAGVKDIYFRSLAGCDSIVTVTLTVTPTLRSSDTPVVCETELPFAYGDSIFTQAGVKDIYFKSLAGCDSIVTVTLTVMPTLRSSDTPVVCETELPFAYGDSIFTQAGVKDIYFRSLAGCDSIVTVTLTVTPTLRSSDTPVVCETELPFAYGDSIFTQAGVKDIYFRSLAGCDSIVTVTLTVMPTLRSSDTPVVCETELPFAYGDSTFTQAGVKDIYFRSLAGCDSIVTVTLTVTPTLRSSDTPVVCETELPFAYGDSTFTQAGVKDIYFRSLAGCDSIVTVTLTVMPTLRSSDTPVVCETELPFAYGDSIFTQAGVKDIYFRSLAGCDSIVTVTLTVMPTLRSSDTPVVCETELPFAYGDSTFTQAGVKDIYFRSLAGCDSIVTVTLTVTPTLRSSDTPVVCETELPFAYGDSTFTQAGVKDIYFRSLAGCDSIVTVTLTVTPTLRSSDTPVVCETELPFAYGDSTFTQAGVKEIYFRSLAGCDSIVTVTLTVMPTLRSSDTPVVCETELPFAYGDSIFTQAGVKDIYFKSLAGCDSIVTVTLTVMPTLRSSDTPVVCETELPFAYGDSTFTQAGVKDIYFRSLAGCDSIVTVTLTVMPTLRSSDTPVVCETELPFAYGDSTFTQAGVKDIYFRSLAGCDSIVTVTLTVTPTLRSSDTPVVCETELPFAYGDSTFTQAGVKDIYFRSLAGCDSIVTVTLTVMPTLRSSDTPVVCETELPFAYGDSIFTQAGVKDIYFRSLAGCDSIVTVTLTVTPTLRSSDTPVVCETELPFAYGDSTFTQAGVKDIYFRSLAGCDSIVTVTLTVTPTLRSSDTPVVCETELPFAYGDSIFTQAGVKDIYFRSLAGCDSIVTVTLTVMPTLRSSDTPVVCETELPFAYGDSTFTQAGVKDIYFRSLAGCDSIVTVTLTVTPTLRSSDTPVVCETELPFAYGDSTFTQAGVKDIYFRSLAGCDSIVTVTLTVMPTLRSSDTPVVCETELPFAYGDSIFTQAGVKDIYFRSLAGCDSIVTVTLTVMPTLRSSDTPVVCETELPFAYGDSTFTQAGVKDIYFRSLAGCDSIVTVTLTVTPTLRSSDTPVVCETELPFAYGDSTFTQAGVKDIYFRSLAGCDSIVTVTLTVTPTLRSSDTPVVCETELPFAYGDSTFTQAGVKDIYFRSLAGCDSIVTVTLTVTPTLRSSDTPVVCETELPFAYGDSTFTQAGVKDIYFRSLAGCDSIVTVTLTVMPTLRSSDTPVVCETELPFAYGDSIFTQAGVKDIYFRSLAGCDSIVTVTLTVMPTLRSSDTPVVCETELPFAYGDSTFTQAGVKDIYFRSLAGCDSIVTVTLTVTPTLRSSDTPVVCETELPFAYGDSTFTQAGVKDIYFRSLAGCDSIVTVTLTVTPTLRSSDTPVVCETELPFAYGDSTFTQAGVKEIYFRSLAGCDSIVTVTLTVMPTLRSSDTPVVCETELPFAYGDSIFTQAGVKDIYFKSLAGCDSIVTVTLTVMPTLRSSDTPVVCETELPFAYGDSTFTQAGVKDIYFRSLAGCDSIVTVTLTVMPTLRSSDTPVVCETELPFAYGDSTFTQAGVKDIYFRSLAGCDSIVTVTLTVTPTLRSSDTPVVCETELPFAYGDSTFTQAGVKDIYFRSLAGCDSIVTVTLTVMPTLRSSDTPVVCETELPFAYGDSIFTQAGVKDIYFRSLAGCDSIVTVTLTVTPTLRSSDTPVVCETELPFAYGDSTFTQAGVKDIYFRSLAGCDSIVTVTLTVTPTLRSSDTPVVCETELPFAYGDSIFTQAGVKDIYFRSLAGCDSIVTVTLTVMPTLRSSDTPVVCETELPFAYGDSTFTQAGVKDIYFRSLAGCDSIVTVTLTVTPTLRSSDTPVVCETELPFAYGDSTFTQAGVKDIYFRSLAGCDSIVTVTLTVMPTLRSSDTPVVCETELPFAYGDSIFTQAGVKDIYFRSLAGCDSIVTVTLTVMPTLRSSDTPVVCETELPFAYGDSTFTQAGVKDIYFRSLAGCDSIVTVTLTVTPTLRSSDTPVVCETELPFAYGDSTFTQAGVKDIYFRSLAGCDSIVTVTLTVTPTLRSSDTPVVCETELPFAYGDSTFTQAGVKDIYFRSLAGCDSIVTVTLTVTPTLRSSDTPVVCETELPFAYGDSTFTQAGVKDIYFRSLAGCDSIVTVTLTVMPTLRSSDTPVVCETELPFAYGDSTFTQAGVKDIYFRSLAGCDSIVTVTLTVTPTLRSSDTPVVCETELPFAYGDSTFTQAGVKDIYFRSLAGCDSIVTVTLTVMPTLRSSDTPVVCETELPFAYGDSIFTQAGVKDIYFRSLAGCDSIVTVTLTVTPTLRSSDTPVVCETELPFAYGDSTFTQAGVKDIYFRSLAGCDSIVTVTLTVTPTLRSSDTPVVCETELPFAYGDSIFTQAGVKDIYFRSLAGCDSIVTVTLTVMPTLRSSDTPVVCETELPFAYGDSTFTQAGVKDIYFRSLAGCDSIVTVTLTVTPTLRSSDTPVVCETELPFAYGDSTFTQAGVKDIYFRSLAGCDSIVTVTLTVMPTLRSSDTPVVCETELPFAYGDSIFTQAGVKDIYFRSLAGCDSIVTVTLTVMPTLRSSDTPVVCETELPFAYGDSTFTQAGVKDIYFRSLAGCDSIVTVTLTVTPTLRSSDTPVVCETELPFAYGDSTFTQAGVKDIYFRSLAGCDSIVTVTLTVTPTLRSSDTPVVCETELPFAYGDSTFTQAGVKEIYFRSLAGCDSIVTVTLTVMPTLRSSDTPVVCETELPFAYGDSTFTQAGVKDIYFKSLAGCDSIVTVTLTVMPRPNIVFSDTTVCAPHVIDLAKLRLVSGDTTGLTFTYYDNNHNLLANTRITATNTYHIVGTNISGCSDTSTVHLVFQTKPILNVIPNEVTYCMNDASDALSNIFTPSISSDNISNYKLTWYLNRQEIDPTTEKPSTNSAGVVTYSLIAEHNTSGCSDTAEISIKVKSYIQFDQTTEYTIPKGNELTIPLSFKIPDPFVKTPASIIWKENGTGIIAVNLTEYTTMVTGNHSYTVEASDPDYCPAQINLNVYAEASLQMSLSLAEYKCCDQYTVQLTIDTTGTGSFIHNPGDDLIQVEEVIDNMSRNITGWQNVNGSLVLNVNPPKDASYIVTFRYDGQTLRDTVAIRVLQPIKVTLPPTIRVCEGVETQLELPSVTPSETGIEWIDPLGNNTIVGPADKNSVTINPKYIGGADHRSEYTYIVRATLASCGQKDYEVTVLVDEALNGNIPDTAVCEGTFVTLDASIYEADTYIWKSTDDFTGTRSGSTIGVHPEKSSAYTVEMTRGECSASDDIYLEILSAPKIISIDSIGISDREIIVDPYSGVYPFLYGVDGNPADSHPDKYGLRIGSHTFHVTDAMGCRSEMTYKITAPRLIFPPVFTPNGDGIDDRWEIIGLKEFYPDADVKIYDRFGKLLVKYKGTELGWDGTYLGHPMPSTDYWYIVYSKDLGREIAGHFTLLRR